jgi:type VI secretion system protein ImpH
MTTPVQNRLDRRAKLLAQAEEAPYNLDFFALSRALENLHPDMPRLGTALRPADEPVRYCQDISLAFAPAAISSVGSVPGGGTVRVGIRFMGLFGPNGAMPLHLTEYAHDRQLHGDDSTLAAFADIFHHRMILLMYRSWAQAQPVISLDRSEDSRFDAYIGALFGSGESQWQGRDAVQDAAKLHNAGLLARGVKNADGLRDILATYLGVPVRIESYVGHWLPMQERDRTRLGDAGGSGRLGGGATLGSAIWDCQSKFRIRIGALDWADYERFLPGESGAIVVRDWVRQYIGFDLGWDLAVSLKSDQVPSARLGGKPRIGLSCWIGKSSKPAPKEDLIFDPENCAGLVPPTLKGN